MNDARRALPSVNAVLADAERAGLTTGAPSAAVVDAIRAALDHARTNHTSAPVDLLEQVRVRLATRHQTSLIPVINATGVILHTNLGRAPLPASARKALVDAGGYVALEYELDEGKRGSRQDHTRDLLRQLTGAGDAFVSTNAAAALLLTLNTLAEGGETIVSRGELVEIGGGFRIPEILAKSGSTLVEVGTTNRVHRADYAAALSPRTRCVLKVHRSNFSIAGFTSEVSVEEIVALAGPQGIPVVHDVGSGLLVDLAAYGLTGEPRVQPSVTAGAVVVFSGDKLLGGPQAGIIVGPAALIERIAANQLARALRPDKSTLAALEATLALYRDPAVALAEVPVLRMITAPAAELASRARRLAKKIGGAKVVPGQSSVGGGSFPDARLSTSLVAVETPSCETMLEVLRHQRPAVVARAHDGHVVLDVRTIADDEFAAVAEAVRATRG